MGTATSLLRVKQPGFEADQSPPSSAEVKNVSSYTSTPQYVFMEWCLVKHMENFTFITSEVYKSSDLSNLSNIWHFLALLLWILDVPFLNLT
jgi:hypothetical protein